MRKKITEQLKWTYDNKVLLLSGKLDKNALNPLWKVRYEIMQSEIQQINLNNITNIDTAGIALLIHLIAIGKKQKKNIFLTNINKNICTLAQLYNLTVDILPY